MGFLISSAYAAAPAAPATAAAADGSFSMLMIVAIFVLFYFMLIRPQNKRAKEQRALITNLKSGDEIVTSGGILGKISHLGEQFIKITLAEGIEITVQRSAVANVLPKGTLKSL